jgi:hypothetical protein
MRVFQGPNGSHSGFLADQSEVTERFPAKQCVDLDVSFGETIILIIGYFESLGGSGQLSLGLGLSIN